ncbi:MAG TPA: hypothetical protein ENN60_02070 [archaeon]|nr:hypothetical protein [archaeon]
MTGYQLTVLFERLDPSIVTEGDREKIQKISKRYYKYKAHWSAGTGPLPDLAMIEHLFPAYACLAKAHHQTKIISHSPKFEKALTDALYQKKMKYADLSGPPADKKVSLAKTYKNKDLPGFTALLLRVGEAGQRSYVTHKIMDRRGWMVFEIGLLPLKMTRSDEVIYFKKDQLQKDVDRFEEYMKDQIKDLSP